MKPSQMAERPRSRFLALTARDIPKALLKCPKHTNVSYTVNVRNTYCVNRDQPSYDNKEGVNDAKQIL